MVEQTAVATGVKRSVPDKVVFTYQGDGEFASIGMGESILHSPEVKNHRDMCQ